MPVTTIVILSSIIFVFVAFGIVLAWAGHRTRHWGRNEMAYLPRNQETPLSLRVIDSESDGTRVSEAA